MAFVGIFAGRTKFKYTFSTYFDWSGPQDLQDSCITVPLPLLRETWSTQSVLNYTGRSPQPWQVPNIPKIRSTEEHVFVARPWNMDYLQERSRVIVRARNRIRRSTAGTSLSTRSLTILTTASVSLPLASPGDEWTSADIDWCLVEVFLDPGGNAVRIRMVHWMELRSWMAHLPVYESSLSLAIQALG